MGQTPGGVRKRQGRGKRVGGVNANEWSIAASVWGKGTLDRSSVQGTGEEADGNSLKDGEQIKPKKAKDKHFSQKTRSEKKRGGRRREKKGGGVIPVRAGKLTAMGGSGILARGEGRKDH